MGGKSSSSTSSSSTTQDQRTGADGNAIAVGAGATLSFTNEFPDEIARSVEKAFETVGASNEGVVMLGKSIINLSSQAIGSVAQTARDAGEFVGKLAERQKADETGAQVQDFLPFVGVVGGLFVLYTLLTNKKVF